MFIRDAVNSDQIPPITRVNINGYAAYRFGHAFFDFVEAEWGKDAVRELVFEFRSFLGKDIAAALKRAFEIEPDDFNLKFRRYLRRKYLPLLAVKGEASEYGERFRVGAWERPSYEVGAAPSPSGDFVATLTTYKDDVDIALLSTKTRKLWKNLSPGRTTKYEYISAQFLTQGPESGRDLSFAPDGDRIAVFARRERGRQLFIFSARGGGVVERIPVAPDMPLSPAFSPDGKSVVFSGISGTSRDIFLLDLDSKPVRNLTSDEGYDTAPVFSPDGKYLYHTKVVAGLQKIVRFPAGRPLEDRAGHVGRGERRRRGLLARRHPPLLRLVPGRHLQHLRAGPRRRASSSSTPTSSARPSGRPPTSAPTGRRRSSSPATRRAASSSTSPTRRSRSGGSRRRPCRPPPS